jgi:hypothetical protein
MNYVSNTSYHYVDKNPEIRAKYSITHTTYNKLKKLIKGIYEDDILTIMEYGSKRKAYLWLGHEAYTHIALLDKKYPDPVQSKKKWRSDFVHFKRTKNTNSFYINKLLEKIISLQKNGLLDDNIWDAINLSRRYMRWKDRNPWDLERAKYRIKNKTK